MQADETFTATPTQTAPKTWVFPRVVSWQHVLYALEVSLIVVVALWTAGDLLTADTTQRLGGQYTEWLTAPAQLASNTLRDYGYLPLWQPYYDYGEPSFNTPYSFLLNPFNSVPSLLLSETHGVRISAALAFVLAGLGGWALGRALDMSPLGRVMLGLLLVGKGGMAAHLGAGFFQLGTSQAFTGWVFAGLVFTLRTRTRWSIVLTALSFALMVFSGQVWHLLPTLLGAVSLALVYVLWRGASDLSPLERGRRLAWVALLTVGLCSVVLLPRIAHNGHYLTLTEGISATYHPLDVLLTFVRNGGSVREIANDATLHNYTVPLWFLVAVFVVLPPLPQRLYRAARRDWQVWWLVGLAMIALLVVWGMGGSVQGWFYESIPFLKRWTVPALALHSAAFWLAVIVSLRVDGLWRIFAPTDFPPRALEFWLIRAALAAAVAIVTLAAIYDSVSAAKRHLTTTPITHAETTCIDWVRAQTAAPASAYRFGYDLLHPFIDSQVRLSSAETGNRVVPIASTIGAFDAPPRHITAWGIAEQDTQRQHLETIGYIPVDDSAVSCVYRYPTPTLPYAFTVPLSTLENATTTQLDPTWTAPVQGIAHGVDRVAVQAQANAEGEVVLLVQEVAYPGWRVWVNGERAELESVAGFVGVRLPAGDALHTVRFQYAPTTLYIGGLLTVLTALGCAGYLLFPLVKRPAPAYHLREDAT